MAKAADKSRRTASRGREVAVEGVEDGGLGAAARRRRPEVLRRARVGVGQGGGQVAGRDFCRRAPGGEEVRGDDGQGLRLARGRAEAAVGHSVAERVEDEEALGGAETGGHG